MNKTLPWCHFFKTWDRFLRKWFKSRDLVPENHGILGRNPVWKPKSHGILINFHQNPVCGRRFPGFWTEIPFYERKSRDSIPQIPGSRPEDRSRIENPGIPDRKHRFRIENPGIWMKIWWKSRALDENIWISTPKAGFPDENPGLRSSGLIRQPLRSVSADGRISKNRKWPGGDFRHIIVS